MACCSHWRISVIGAALALDAGQTGIRALLSNGFEAEFAGILTHLPIVPQLAAIVAEVSAQAGVRLDTVSAGVSGLRADDDPAELLQATQQFGITAAYLTHDSVSSYLGALGDTRGAVVASGTGVVTLGVGARSVARVDGWGNIMGDAGSGYWLGREALDAVMRAHDGRGEATALTEVVQREFPDLEQAYIELQSDPARVRRIAAYARVVAELGESDAVAARICATAADELVVSVAAALRRVGEVTSPVVCGIGGVFRSAAIRTGFENGICELWPDARLRGPAGAGIDGAALLPRVGSASALRGLVAVARLS
jgi:glucosamine kinase